MKRLWLCLFWICTSSVALAAPPSDHAMEAARQHFVEGTKAYTLGDYGHAVVEYKAAYDAEPDPALLYNIAQSYRLARDPVQALFFYRAYLLKQPNASNHVEIEQRIRELETATLPEPVPSPTLDATLTAPLSPAPKPLYKKGWFWGTVVGVAVVAGVGLGVGLGLGLSRESVPSTGLGNDKVFSLAVRR